MSSLEALLSDPGVTDLCINGPDRWFIDRGAGLTPFPAPIGWSHDTLSAWVLDQLAQVGKSWDAKHPFVDASLPSGHRIHIVFPPLSGPSPWISLRRLPREETDAQAADRRWSGSPLFPLLKEIVRRGESLLIAGATGSGKTTLANDLLASVPGHERIIALEDTPELKPRHPHFLSLTSRPPNADGCGEITLRTLLKQTLRMRPDRVILGECRGAEVLDLLQALNTGHRGALATIHANSARDALRRVELLCLLSASGTLPIPMLRELISSGIRWVAQVERLGGTRSIVELQRIEGREGDTILLRPMVQFPHASDGSEPQLVRQAQ